MKKKILMKSLIFDIGDKFYSLKSNENFQGVVFSVNSVVLCSSVGSTTGDVGSLARISRLLMI